MSNAGGAEASSASFPSVAVSRISDRFPSVTPEHEQTAAHKHQHTHTHMATDRDRYARIRRPGLISRPPLASSAREL